MELSEHEKEVLAGIGSKRDKTRPYMSKKFRRGSGGREKIREEMGMEGVDKGYGGMSSMQLVERRRMFREKWKAYLNKRLIWECESVGLKIVRGDYDGIVWVSKGKELVAVVEIKGRNAGVSKAQEPVKEMLEKKGVGYRVFRGQKWFGKSLVEEMEWRESRRMEGKET